MTSKDLERVNVLNDKRTRLEKQVKANNLSLRLIRSLDIDERKITVNLKSFNNHYIDSLSSFDPEDFILKSFTLSASRFLVFLENETDILTKESSSINKEFKELTIK